MVAMVTVGGVRYRPEDAPKGASKVEPGPAAEKAVEPRNKARKAPTK